MFYLSLCDSALSSYNQTITTWRDFLCMNHQLETENWFIRTDFLRILFDESFSSATEYSALSPSQLYKFRQFQSDQFTEPLVCLNLEVYPAKSI